MRERLRRTRGAALVILATSAAPLTGQTTLSGRAETLVRAYHDLGRFNGAALVVYDGDPLLENTYGFARLADGTVTNGTRAARDVPNHLGTRFPIGSLGRSFTAALILRLWEGGTLHLEAPVREYLPDAPWLRDDGVTIHHLLVDPGSVAGAAGPGAGDVDAASGVLRDVAETVTGRPYDALLGELVLDPVGLAHTGVESEPASGPGHAAGLRRSLGGIEPATAEGSSLRSPTGVVYSTVEDLGRWADALSRFETGRPFQRAETLERMRTPAVEGQAYGLAVHARPLGREDAVRVLERADRTPGFSAAMRIFPDHGRAIVLLDNTSSDLEPLLEGLTNLLWGAEAPRPKPSIAERLLPIVETAGIEAALDRYRNWRTTRPDRYDYGAHELVRLARHLADGGHPERAFPALETAIELFPHAAEASVALFELDLEAGDTVQAVSRLEAALTWRPGDPRLLEPLLDLGAEPPAVLRFPVTGVTTGAMERVTGSYRIDPATSLEIRREGHGLVAQRTGEAGFPLLPQGETTYLLEGSAIQLSFQMDGERAASVAIVESGQRVTFPRIPDLR